MHARPLQPAHVGRADRADEVRVLADALVDPAPAGVADDVEHRGQALVDAELLHRAADGRGHLLDELGVERGAPRERRREGRRLPRCQSGQALLVHQRRDAQPGLALQPSLLVPEPRGALRRIDRTGAVDPGVVPDAVAGHVGRAPPRLFWPAAISLCIGATTPFWSSQ